MYCRIFDDMMEVALNLLFRLSSFEHYKAIAMISNCYINASLNPPWWKCIIV